MSHEEITVRVMFKPNCGLENTRAALVIRRITPLCDTVSCYPRTVKSDPGTITYLRDHGLFISFTSSLPEQVLMAIKGAFFVDECTLVDDPSDLPLIDVTDREGSDQEDQEDPSIHGLPSTFADRDARSERDDELTGLLARFEEVNRALRAQIEQSAKDQRLSSIMFTHTQIVDDLRTTVARSRIEPFDRIAPSLHALVEDYGRRFGIAVDLDIAESHVALDRSVLASMEEALKRALRSCIRDGIESPHVRVAAGKPARATIHVRVENDGSDIICRIEHDGYALDTQAVGQIAFERGMLTRPLDTYSQEEIGAFLLLPRFALATNGSHSAAFTEFNEIGSLLQHVGGRGEVHNTERGTMEIALFFPVPFTVLEVALLRVGEMRFALPAQQIKRFEAFHADRVEPSAADDAHANTNGAQITWYLSEEGARYELLNRKGESTPLDADSPAYVILLEVWGERRALAVDDVKGYERISVNQLPALLDRQTLRDLGCIGYAILEDGTLCPVLSIRRLLKVTKEQGSHHA